MKNSECVTLNKKVFLNGQVDLIVKISVLKAVSIHLGACLQGKTFISSKGKLLTESKRKIKFKWRKKNRKKLKWEY